jgi:hypothetical protein
LSLKQFSSDATGHRQLGCCLDQGKKLADRKSQVVGQRYSTVYLPTGRSRSL